MAAFADRFRTRIIPALLTAIGVALLAGGLLSYTNPVAADPLPTDTPLPSVAAVVPTPSPLITLPPLGSGAPPSASAKIPADRVATRVRIAALGIDLPIVKPPKDPTAYPYCNVAMYLQVLGQPGEGHATYIYAHARTGMFLPLLTSSLVQNGKKMLGMVVEVWTNDDQRFLYEITDVRRHTTDLNDAINAKGEELWLQTSEGPHGWIPKLQVRALPLSQEDADPADANPTPHPVACG
jgi:hypothetical protein